MSKKMTTEQKAIAATQSKVKRIAAADAKETIKTENAKIFAKSIVAQLDDLSIRRDDWERTDYQKANEGLYALLAECLNVFQQRFIKANDDERKQLRSMLIERLKANGVRVVKTSTTLTMLARYVFNSDRKRAQGYGYVLAAAASHDITAERFPAWVVEQGGIEEIKRKMIRKPEAIARAQAVEVATTEVKHFIELNSLQPLASVVMEGLKGDYAVLLAKPKLDGSADIVASLSEINDALLNALVQRMAKAQVAKEEANRELNRQVANETQDLLAPAQTSELMVANS